MFRHLQGAWVSISSEVPAYDVGKDRVCFQPEGRIEYTTEHEGKVYRLVFETRQDGEDYLIYPIHGGPAREPLRIRISNIKENEIEIMRLGMKTVYRRKKDPIPRPQPTPGLSSDAADL